MEGKIFERESLQNLDWRSFEKFDANLLQQHADGNFGNQIQVAQKPIRVFDQLQINPQKIVAQCPFPPDWPFDREMDLTMLFHHQFDQLIQFWFSREFDAPAQLLTSGSCELFRPIKFEAGKNLEIQLSLKNFCPSQKKALFDAQIFDGRVLLAATQNIECAASKIPPTKTPPTSIEPFELAGKALQIPIWDPMSRLQMDQNFFATQKIHPSFWLFAFQPKPIFPLDFAAHGMVELLKNIAFENFELENSIFDSLESQTSFGQMPAKPTYYKIRFELFGVSGESPQTVAAKKAQIFVDWLDGGQGTRIWECTNLRVKSGTNPPQHCARMIQQTVWQEAA